MTATCSTCKHWDTEDMEPGFKYCALGETVEGKPVFPNLPMRTVDSEGWYAGLRTRAEFGCILHEPRERGTT